VTERNDDTVTETWKFHPNTPAEGADVFLVSKLRIIKPSGPFTSDEDDENVLVTVNSEKELFSSPLGNLQHVAPNTRVLELPPLLIIGGLALQVFAGPRVRKADVIVERLSQPLDKAATTAWYLQNKTYPTSWYGVGDIDAAKKKIDETIAAARAEGLTPKFVRVTAGEDGSCAACRSSDPERGPYHAQLLTSRHDPVFIFAVPLVCGVCAEDNEAINKLVQRMTHPDIILALGVDIDTRPSWVRELVSYRRGQRMKKPRAARRFASRDIA
jgi:hypothetical protein